MIYSHFVTDLHGKADRYNKLFDAVKSEKPEILFIGGDIFPNFYKNDEYNEGFAAGFLLPGFENLKKIMGSQYPNVFIIMGNDDAASEEFYLTDGENSGLWHYINMKFAEFKDYKIFGYNYVPPTPFLLKDWERYDVSRYADPGCISPEEGKSTIELNPDVLRNSTIQKDLLKLTEGFDPDKSVFLFHTPPYQTKLDRAALDGKFIDHVPLDVNVGSIAVKKFIEKEQPYLTLHGHVHESTSITGCWMDKIGKTICFNGCTNESAPALIKFDLEEPEKAERVLL